MDDANILIKTGKDGSITIICEGSLDLTNSSDFHDKLKTASQTAENVIVDISKVDFIDTQIVQDLANAAVTLLKRNKRLKTIVNHTAYPLRVLTVTSLQSIMDIEIVGRGSA